MTILLEVSASTAKGSVLALKPSDGKLIFEEPDDRSPSRRLFEAPSLDFAHSSKLA